VAKNIAARQFSETTLGYTDIETAKIWQQLFDTPYFRVNGVPDVAGVEVCGAVKNIIALAAGFCDGMNYGSNTKAAIIRIGVEEMRNFASIFFDGVLEDTFFDSAGWADVITTCLGGRHVKCAQEFIRQKQQMSWDDIEKEMMGGMKLQGHVTSSEVHQTISFFGLEEIFPLFTATYRVAFEKAPPETIITIFSSQKTRPLKLAEEVSKCKLRNDVLNAKNMTRVPSSNATSSC